MGQNSQILLKIIFFGYHQINNLMKQFHYLSVIKRHNTISNEHIYIIISRGILIMIFSQNLKKICYFLEFRFCRATVVNSNFTSELLAGL